MFRLSKKYHQLPFTNDLVSMPPTRKKTDILRALSNLTRYLDIRHDTELHEQFTRWLKRKEIKWTTKLTTDMYQISKTVKLEQVLQTISNLPHKPKIFTTFVLVSGLRTGEAVKAFNHHAELCHDNMMELFWDRGTKKSNAVFCHPLLHEKMTFKVSRENIHNCKGLNLKEGILGFELRLLRKLNFTINARIDPLLAEFMQGRRGNVSERHYFLPTMTEHKIKWMETWTPIVNVVVNNS